MNELPADPFFVALFILKKIQEGVSFAVVDAIFYSIKFFHVSVNLQDPCDTPVVENLYEAAKRLLFSPKNRKEPITIDLIHKIYDNLIRNNLNHKLTNLRLFVLIILGYTGFLRYSELSVLRRCDFISYDTYMEVFIEKSKCDVYREGKWLTIAKFEDDICPVKNLKLYLESSLIDEESDEYIFRAITDFPKQGFQKLKKLNKPLSYTRAREIILEALKDVGEDPKKYGTHSLRSGGASSAANAGIPDRMFKRHGRWKSEKAKDGYIKDNLTSLLSVSRSLGIS